MSLPSTMEDPTVAAATAWALQFSRPRGEVAQCVSFLSSDPPKESLSSSSWLEEDPSDTTLILHFDINETILLGDQAGGDTVEKSLQKILAKSAFVQFPTQPSTASSTNSDAQVAMDWSSTQQMEPTHWWNGMPIGGGSANVDGDNDAETTTKVPPLYTGWQWPPNTCPYYRTAFKPRVSEFVQLDGQVYAETYQKLQQVKDSIMKIRPLPPNSKEDAADDDEHLQGMFSAILPAFWKVLAALTESKHLSWRLVLRTMGNDLPQISSAITAFAQGRHPDYPHIRDARLMFRADTDQLVEGRWVAAAATSDASNTEETKNRNYTYQLWTAHETTQVASGDEEVLEYIQRHTVCGIRDDYPHWKRNEYQPWSGKPVWKRLHHKKEHHIMFDDNIHNLPDDGIVSIREERQSTSDYAVSCFVTLPGSDIVEQHGKHLIRVPTVEPLLDDDWFLRQIQGARREYLSPPS